MATPNTPQKARSERQRNHADKGLVSATVQSPLSAESGEQATDRLPFEHSLRRGIAALLPQGSRVLLAVSGGPDSVALLIGWSKLAAERDDQLHVAHLDHRLRPDSAEDAQFVEALTQQLGITCHLALADSALAEQAGRSLEEAARHARYQFLTETARSLGAAAVATGHHADDQAETVLHAILRGTGIHGLAGMPRERALGPTLRLIRPMLGIRRHQIEEYLSVLDQPTRTDDSNSDRRFTRNRLRADLLPHLRQTYNPRVDDALLRLARLAEDSSRLLRRQADELLQQATISADDREALLRVEILAMADPLLAAEAVRLLAEQQCWPRAQLGYAELERIVSLIHGPPRAACDLAGGYRAERVKRPVAALRLSRRSQASC